MRLPRGVDVGCLRSSHAIFFFAIRPFPRQHRLLQEESQGQLDGPPLRNASVEGSRAAGIQLPLQSEFGAVPVVTRFDPLMAAVGLRVASQECRQIELCPNYRDVNST